MSTQTKRATGVAIGITGAWGSGKSSVLNLVEERVRADYPSALVVRFDPWLVSGRNDLIEAFISELLASISEQVGLNTKAGKALKATLDRLHEYAELLRPAADLLWAGAGTLSSATIGTIKKATTGDRSLPALRRKLFALLAASDVPIVVLIDEVDRVEDGEIRAVAQLVRAVADFPGMSYLLAYDPDRVAQALGAGAAEEEVLDRGRAYLEKIVQLQIPLPKIGDDEVQAMLVGELKKLQGELRLPANFAAIPRFEELLQIVSGGVIETPRDVSRCIGAYHALGGMLLGEVDWADLFGYAVLLTKAPAVIKAIRAEPGVFIDEVITRRDAVRDLGADKKSKKERLKLAIPTADQLPATTIDLITYLFPKLGEFTSPDRQHVDAISERRALLTTLRLGLLPGHHSRQEVERMMASEPEVVAATLSAAYEKDTLENLIDRLDDLYLGFNAELVAHLRIWRGVAQFARKPDCEWPSSYEPMHAIVRQLAVILERAVTRNGPSFGNLARKIFEDLSNSGDTALTD